MRSGLKRRRRGLILLLLAGATAALSVSLVTRHTDAVNAQLGPLQEVLMTKKDLPKDTFIKPDNVERYLEVRLVAERFVPRKHFSSVDQVVGLKSQVDIPAGTYVSIGQVSDAESQNDQEIRDGLRAVEISVEASRFLAGMIVPGSRVDFLVTMDGEGGPSVTYLAYENLPVLRAVKADDEGGKADGLGSEGGSRRMLVTVRVTAKTAVYLVAAENFAKQLRVLPRPVGDNKRVGSLSMHKSRLKP